MRCRTALSRSPRLPVALAALAALGLVFAPNADAVVIDFDDLGHGEIIAGQYTGIGVDIRVYNSFRDHEVGVAFDSELRGTTSDPDLQRSGAWRGGNLAPGTVLDRLLIIQERLDSCGASVCSDPDDEGRRPAGHFDIRFAEGLTEFGFDLVDIDDATAERGAITLYDDTAALSQTIGFDEFVTAGPNFDASIAYGDGSANRIAPLTAAGLGLGAIDRVLIEMGGSGGVDNLSFERAVPEPTAAVVFGAGLLTLAGARRQRR